MSQYQLMTIQDASELERIYPVMKELRKDLSLNEFITIFKQAYASEGYNIIAMEDSGKVVALMGYRILHDLVHGRHIYIDDLVSTQSERSKGHGAYLLKHAEQLAHELGCSNLRLSTGIENELGKKFYEREGWSLRAVVFKKKLSL